MNANKSANTNAKPALHGWQRIFNSFFNELQASDYTYLLSSLQHPHLLAIKRTGIIVSRVRLVAILFAIMTPLWSVIDFFVFSAHIWVPMTLLRAITGFAFLALFLYYKPRKKPAHAYRALFFLLLIPSVFYPISQYLLIHADLSEHLAQLVLVGYTFLPFVLIASLAIFPITLKENLALSSLIMSAQLLGIILSNDNQLANIIGIIWLLALLGCIATMAGISQLALMAALVRQTIRDTITGCFTRSSGEELLSLQFAIAQRSKTALSLAFIDLDNFKAVNDQFGHEAGDIVLRHAATAIMNELRDSDLLARWGGEEFLLIMPNTSISQAKTAMERLRRLGLCKRPDGTVMTASVGISEVWRDAVSDTGQLVDLADQRMYLAKESGRNAIFCADDSAFDTKPNATQNAGAANIEK
ncbi:MAG: GGDEF domain-containing protein [Betaproteobacteria bacterium]|nr:GGDEF domain-containing protein [Betaproteobacteria bacterium]